MKTVVTFGEIMLRLSPPGYERFFQSPMLQATFGGGEANVAVSLAQFGFASRFVSALPPGPIGDAAIRALAAEGVDTRFVARRGSRLGIYFAETGASQRASTVVYDRAHSAASTIDAGAIDWAAAVRGADWLHLTGITPALGPGPADAARRLVQFAKAAGAKISIDLNYRRKLWTEAEAQRVMRPLVADVDLVIANEEDLQSVLGIHVENTDVTGGQLDLDGYARAARTVATDLGPAMVAITLRESFSANDNGWSAVLWDGAQERLLRSQRYELRIVDRIGGGDSFAAGLIYGLLAGRTPDDTLRFAVAASAIKHTIPGDFNRCTVDEVDRLAGGDGSGRVQR
jgi:2-dehydro-3-deoxygluconokinase